MARVEQALDPAEQALDPVEEPVDLEITTVLADADGLTVLLRGEMDLANVGLLTAVLDNQLGFGRRFVRLDLARLTFLDCTGLGAIVHAHTQCLAAWGTLVLTGVSPRVARLLALTGLDEALFVEPVSRRPTRRVARQHLSVRDRDTVTRSRNTGDVWVEIACAIAAQTSLAGALQVFTAAALTHIGAADAAGMTVPDRNQFDTTAATSDLPATVDALQYQFGGPCVAAILEPAPHVRVEDLRTDTRWPEFAQAATRQTAVRSMLSCRLHLNTDTDAHTDTGADVGEPFGSLNLYAHQPNAFDHPAAATCERFVGYAALAIALVAEREKTADLQRALESSRIIGAATGVLMTRHLITAEQAFDLLRTASQHSDRKLRDIAVDVTESGTLDPALTGHTQHTLAPLASTQPDTQGPADSVRVTR